MVLVSTTLNFFAGGTFFYGKTVFFNPIRSDFGWSYAATSVAYTLQRLESGILGPLAGFMVDRGIFKHHVCRAALDQVNDRLWRWQA